MSSVARSLKSEESTYEPFIQAANYALGRLKKLKADGMIIPHDDSDDTDILFHHDDIPIRKKHQGVESHRQPVVVVVVSHQTAREVFEDGGKPSKNDGSKSKTNGFTFFRYWASEWIEFTYVTGHLTTFYMLSYRWGETNGATGEQRRRTETALG